MGECPHCGSMSLSCGCSGPSYKSSPEHQKKCRDGKCCMFGLLNSTHSKKTKKVKK
jgi:hypothetical protein